MNEPEFHRLVVEQIADAVIGADAQGMIVSWNAAAKSLFGYQLGEAIGQSLNLIIPEKLRPAHWAAYRRAIARGTTKHGGRATLTRALTRAGESIYVEMSFAVLVDAQGKAFGAVAVARDASAHHQEMKELRERLALLEANGGNAADGRM